MKYLLTLAALTLAACSPTQPAKLGAPEGTINDGRYTLERVAVIEDSIAYYGKRGVYILRDTKTGEEWVGVSGIGISETFRAGKHTRDD